jgi:3-hydroxybutyryl-CoA dehydrogenase
MTDVAVVGAGLMGHALALVHALGGHQVRLTDSNPQTLARAPELMATALETLVEGGEADTTWTRQRLAQAVQCVAGLRETVTGAALVVEAIVEEPEAKRTLYGQLADLMAPSAILASNTSHLDVFPLAPASLQSRILIAHWYTPPYLVDLVDVVGGPQCEPQHVEVVRAMYAAMGKQPVVFKTFVPGYVANRIQAAISQEVYRLLDEGVVTPREVDLSVIHGLALRIPILGHLAKADFTGLPLVQRSMANRKDEPAPPPLRNSKLLDEILAKGGTGVMTGKGFFDWGGRSPEALFKDRDRRLMGLKQALRKLGGALEGG